MAGVDLGRVSYVPKTAYDEGVTYSRLDVVSYQGSSYVSLINNNIGNVPVEGVSWSIVAQKGDKGDTGEQGIQGVQGIEGPKGDKGDKGNTGDQGVQGLKGDTGDQGVQGLKGDTGDQGVQGLKGDTGAKGDKGDPGQDGQSAYLDAVAKGYAGTKDEFDMLLAGIERGGVYILPPAFTTLDELSTSEEISLIIGGVDGWIGLKNAIQNNRRIVIASDAGDGMHGILPAGSIALNMDANTEVIQTTFHLGPTNNVFTISKTDVTNVFTATVLVFAFIQSEEGKDLSANDFTNAYKQRVDNAVVPTDIFTVTALASLSNTKYSQIFTYTSATAQPINFSATPAEGFECMLDIKNSTASNITQAIPNASGWQCEDTSVVLPAGKITSISIRRVHGINVVRI